MKEDNRKKIPLPPLVHDRFMALKGDDETTADLVERCIDILSEQDQELENEHSIHVVVDIDDYRWMRYVMGLPLLAPTEDECVCECVVMVVDERALSPATLNGMSSVRGSRRIDPGLRPKEGQTQDEMYAEIIDSRTR